MIHTPSGANKEPFRLVVLVAVLRNIKEVFMLILSSFRFCLRLYCLHMYSLDIKDRCIYSSTFFVVLLMFSTHTDSDKHKFFFSIFYDVLMWLEFPNYLSRRVYMYICIYWSYFCGFFA